MALPLEGATRAPLMILASASPRRADLLTQAGIRFEIRPSSIPEEIRLGEPPRDFALRLAREKGESVAKKCSKGAFVLGADTIVCLNGELFGKPCDATQARAFLETLCGKTHDVMTAYAIIEAPDRIVCWGIALSHVALKGASRDEIAAYVATGEPMDKAGAYAAQGIGKKFIERVEGSFTNVVGLPMEDLLPWFDKLSLRGAKGDPVATLRTGSAI